MRKRSIWLVAILIILVLMFAFTRTLKGQQNTSRELQLKNSEINAHNAEKRNYNNRPSNTKVDPSYERYLNSKSERLEKERSQIIERGFQQQNRGK